MAEQVFVSKQYANKLYESQFLEQTWRDYVQNTRIFGNTQVYLADHWSEGCIGMKVAATVTASFQI